MVSSESMYTEPIRKKRFDFDAFDSMITLALKEAMDEPDIENTELSLSPDTDSA